MLPFALLAVLSAAADDLAAPLTSSQVCAYSAGLVHISSSSPAYAVLRQSFSKFYPSWPLDICLPRIPILPDGAPVASARFVPATRAQMDAATIAVEEFVYRTGLPPLQPFVVRSGGHSNAGASNSLARTTLDVRGLNIIQTEFLNGSDFPTSVQWSAGRVVVGSGATAGQATFVTFSQSQSMDSLMAGALPVGQKPTVGMAGEIVLS